MNPPRCFKPIDTRFTRGRAREGEAGADPGNGAGGRPTCDRWAGEPGTCSPFVL